MADQSLLWASGLGHSRNVLRLCPEGSGLEHDLFASVLLVLEDVVAVRRLLQWERVRDDPRRVDLTGLDALQQRLHVALDVALAGPQGQGAVHERPGGE